MTGVAAISEHMKTGVSFLDQIDWQRPWLSPLRPLAEKLLQAPNWRSALNAAAVEIGLRNHRGMPLRFVAQSDLPPNTAYEAFISATGCVPTRDNLHDFFNALIWLAFPGLKTQLNVLQAAEIANSANTLPVTSSTDSRRGKLRDAATIFDENAALLIVRDMKLIDALRNHQWHEVFVMQRTAFMCDYEVRLFGHALIEKLISPYKAITAHAWIVKTGDAFFAMSEQDKQIWLDLEVSQQLKHGLATSDFTPLPVLGVPFWWSNQDSIFYEDATVFRAKRTRSP